MLKYVNFLLIMQHATNTQLRWNYCPHVCNFVTRQTSVAPLTFHSTLKGAQLG